MARTSLTPLMALLMIASLPLSDRAFAGIGLERLVMPGEVSTVHMKVEDDCDQCHVSFDKQAQDGACLVCHEAVEVDRREHRGHHGRAGQGQCRECHSEHKGRDFDIAAFDRTGFEHAATDFPLLGKHRERQCGECHADGSKFRDAATECAACHVKDDAHDGRLGRDCGQCHRSDDWRTTRFDHATTGFALAGAHAIAKCDACHVQPPADKRLDTDCVACHRVDDHHRGALGPDCRKCHDEHAWKPTRFDHGKTGYPLLGRHAQVQCTACHEDRKTFKGASGKCAACHRSDDRHRGSLGAACADCHDPSGWKPARGFDHARTSFVLSGGHLRAQCRACHADPAHMRGTSHACIDCHRKDDTHHGRNGDDCAECHGSDDWKRSRFDHDRQTHFILRGAHRSRACADCHRGDVHRERPPSECAGCHRADDPHKGTVGAACAACHDESAWKPSHFEHDDSHFVLLGAHRLASCTRCHPDSRYGDVLTDCVGCHGNDDVHDGALGEGCAQCHNSRSWGLAEFDHARQTDFALTGAHAGLRCARCHRERVSAAPHIADACASCHAGDDIHEGSFGRQCERCHETTSFKQITHPLLRGRQ